MYVSELFVFDLCVMVVFFLLAWRLMLVFSCDVCFLYCYLSGI